VIIDTTVSVMEEKMERNRRIDLYKDRQSKKSYNKKAVRKFLLTKGQDPGFHFNYVAFWKDGKIFDAHFVCDAVKDREAVKMHKEKIADFRKVLEKFENFMRFAKLSTQNSPKLLK